MCVERVYEVVTSLPCFQTMNVLRNIWKNTSQISCSFLVCSFWKKCYPNTFNVETGETAGNGETASYRRIRTKIKDFLATQR